MIINTNNIISKLDHYYGQELQVMKEFLLECYTRCSPTGFILYIEYYIIIMYI